MNAKVVGACDVIERMVMSVSAELTIVRNHYGEMTDKTWELLRKANVDAIALSRLIAEARSWELTTPKT